MTTTPAEELPSREIVPPECFSSSLPLVCRGGRSGSPRPPDPSRTTMIANVRPEPPRIAYFAWLRMRMPDMLQIEAGVAMSGGPASGLTKWSVEDGPGGRRASSTGTRKPIRLGSRGSRSRISGSRSSSTEPPNRIARAMYRGQPSRAHASPHLQVSDPRAPARRTSTSRRRSPTEDGFRPASSCGPQRVCWIDELRHRVARALLG